MEDIGLLQLLLQNFVTNSSCVYITETFLFIFLNLFELMLLLYAISFDCLMMSCRALWSTVVGLT